MSSILNQAHAVVWETDKVLLIDKVGGTAMVSPVSVGKIAPAGVEYYNPAFD